MLVSIPPFQPAHDQLGKPILLPVLLVLPAYFFIGFQSKALSNDISGKPKKIPPLMERPITASTAENASIMSSWYVSSRWQYVSTTRGCNYKSGPLLSRCIPVLPGKDLCDNGHPFSCSSVMWHSQDIVLW
jgi:hypothetical protein